MVQEQFLTLPVSTGINVPQNFEFLFKVERTTVVEAGGEVRLYRAIEPLLPTTGLVRIPCAICPIVKFCSSVGSVNPTKCVYLKEWLS